MHYPMIHFEWLYFEHLVKFSIYKLKHFVSSISYEQIKRDPSKIKIIMHQLQIKISL